MSKVSSRRLKFSRESVGAHSARLHDYLRRHSAGALTLLAGAALFFGMPFAYSAANSYMNPGTEPNTAGFDAKGEMAAAEDLLRVEADPDSSANSKSTASSKSTTDITATTNAANPQDSVDVTVNGQSVAVPKNGTVHKKFSSNNGDTLVDVRVEGGGSANSNSSTSIEINSQSYSTGSETNDAEGRHPARR